jgi:hypothetical protein
MQSLRLALPFSNFSSIMLCANFDIKKPGLILALLVLTASGIMAEKPSQDSILFQVLRSRDADRICYEVQLDSNGYLDKITR